MDDLVSRQAVQTMVNSWTYNLCDPEDEWAAMKEIKDLPSAHPELNEWCHECKEYDTDKHCCPRFGQVIRTALEDTQPEQKTGRWIPHEDEDGEHYGDKCSECGEWYVMPYGKTNFCPNCGADMRGEE